MNLHAILNYEFPISRFIKDLQAQCSVVNVSPSLLNRSIDCAVNQVNLAASSVQHSLFVLLSVIDSCASCCNITSLHRPKSRLF